jgi:hypothetical protein
MLLLFVRRFRYGALRFLALRVLASLTRALSRLARRRDQSVRTAAAVAAAVSPDHFFPLFSENRKGQARASARQGEEESTNSVRWVDGTSHTFVRKLAQGEMKCVCGGGQFSTRTSTNRNTQDTGNVWWCSAHTAPTAPIAPNQPRAAVTPSNNAVPGKADEESHKPRKGGEHNAGIRVERERTIRSGEPLITLGLRPACRARTHPPTTVALY